MWLSRGVPSVHKALGGGLINIFTFLLNVLQERQPPPHREGHLAGKLKLLYQEFYVGICFRN